MKKILLTGYTPPRGCLFDATEECAKYFHGKGSYIGVKFTGLVLPNSALEAFRVIERAVKRSKPEVIINMGTMNIAKSIYLETVFNNRQNDGSLIWNTKNAKNFLSPNSDHAKIFDLLIRNNITVQLSNNNPIAIHNELGYLVTKLVSENPLFAGVRNLFIHVPHVWDYESKHLKSDEFYLNKKDYYKAIEIISKSI